MMGQKMKMRMASVSLSPLFLLASVFLLLPQCRVESLLVPVNVHEGNDSECKSAQDLQQSNCTDYPKGEEIKKLGTAYVRWVQCICEYGISLSSPTIDGIYGPTTAISAGTNNTHIRNRGFPNQYLCYGH